MTTRLMRRLPALAALAVMLTPAQAWAHPHVFADARLEVETSADGRVTEFRNVWRFDEVFSSSVVMDFDEDSNLQLDSTELAKIGDMVTQSLADFDYYTSVTLNGDDIEICFPRRSRSIFRTGSC